MSVATATILSEGKPVSAEWSLLSLDVRRELNRLSDATLIYLDGDIAKREFPLSDSANFIPGKSVEIKLRWESVPSSEALIFKGVVVRHGLEVDESGSRLRVELRSEAIRLTHGRQSRVFLDSKDSEVFAKILGDAGLQKGKIDPTKAKHKELVQYHCTDWDFLLKRAGANGRVVFEEEGKVNIREVGAAGQPVLKLELGLDDVFEMETELDGTSQGAGMSVLAWDPASQDVTVQKSAEPESSQGDLKATKVAGDLKIPAGTLRHLVPVEPEELKAWADGCLARERWGYLRGRTSITGTGKVRLLDTLSVGGAGKRFNGQTLVSGIRHRVDESGWRTDLQFGLLDRSVEEESGVLAPPAGGAIPAIRGIQIGVVCKIDEDPSKEFRVQVKLPNNDPARELAIWGRMISWGAGKERGWFLFPEVGDEVVVAFLDDDPRHPIVLGSLFSSKNTPPADLGPVEAENRKKGFVSRMGTKLLFNDADKPSVTLETPAGSKLVLDDDAQSIQLADQHGNEITLAKDGITIKSAKDLTLDAASGNVKVLGKQVDIQ